jgi:flagellar FliJ protein
MTRVERMAPVQQVLEQGEQVRARELGEGQRRLTQAEAKLKELRTYHGEYLQALHKRAEDGINVTKLRDFQAFLGRLELAIVQQEEIVATARDAVAHQRSSWQGAARQVKAVESVVDRWRSAEIKAGQRREQKESDDRAQRGAMRTTGSSEAQ